MLNTTPRPNSKLSFALVEHVIPAPVYCGEAQFAKQKPNYFLKSDVACAEVHFLQIEFSRVRFPEATKCSRHLDVVPWEGSSLMLARIVFPANDIGIIQALPL
jgi:hypothetical protein